MVSQASGVPSGAPRVFDVYDDAGRLRWSEPHFAAASPGRLSLCLGLLAVGVRRSRRILRCCHSTATPPTMSVQSLLHGTGSLTASKPARRTVWHPLCHGRLSKRSWRVRGTSLTFTATRSLRHG